MIDPSSAKAGDKLYVYGEVKPYTVKARDERYIIATKPYNLKRTVLYFIIDLIKGWRGPDDRVFCCGYETSEDIKERLQELRNGEIEVSRRRSVKTSMIEDIKPLLIKENPSIL